MNLVGPSPFSPQPFPSKLLERHRACTAVSCARSGRAAHAVRRDPSPRVPPLHQSSQLYGQALAAKSALPVSPTSSPPISSQLLEHHRACTVVSAPAVDKCCSRRPSPSPPRSLQTAGTPAPAPSTCTTPPPHPSTAGTPPRERARRTQRQGYSSRRPHPSPHALLLNRPAPTRSLQPPLELTPRLCPLRVLFSRVPNAEGVAV